jgi:L-ascorbate metabolism protein UlaG (beta-lactamase superfamily)
MHLTWLGKTCVKIQTKPLEEEVVILIDAYKPDAGEFPRSLSANVALFTKGQAGSTTLTQEPFIIDTLGEFDIKNNIITTWAGPEGSVIYKVHSENISVVHFGPMTTPPTEETLENLGKVDILLLPMGGNKNYFSPTAAAQLANTIEPRIIIPIAYQCDTDSDAEPLTAFIKEIGLAPHSTDKKLIIKSKDLPQEDMELYVLEKNC